MNIAAVELIPTETIYAYFSDTVGQPLSSSFEEVGFEHHLIMDNFGTLGFLFALLPFAYTFWIIIQLFVRAECCAKISGKM